MRPGSRAAQSAVRASRWMRRLHSGRAAAVAPSTEPRVVYWRLGRDPGMVVVPAGQPVRLLFERLDANPATDYVSFPAFGVVSTLVPFVRCDVQLGSREPGRYEFLSPSGRIRGSLLVTH